ncbi:MAG: cysteine desulfurase [Desulfuromonas sp.]|nr:MAG: cysteine desulfurase [Desulfuromonas sp.]
MRAIYLDNAATSHPKPEAVYRAVDTALRSGGSPARGFYNTALDADRIVFETRELLAEIFNGEASERFVFTANATMGINQALFGLLRPGDRVVTTTVEHNAVARPLWALQDRGVIVVKVAADSQSGLVTASALRAACLAEPTRLLVMTHCSNVIGALQPIDELGSWCREQGILFMVDAAQSAGAVPIDLQANKIDLLAAPGHKGLLGPQGTGFLYVRDGIELEPLIYGGTGANSHSDRQPDALPEHLESGTMNLAGLAGLHAALVFLRETGIETIRRHERELTDRLCRGLGDIADVSLYGPENPSQRCAVVSFNMAGQDPSTVGFRLDREFGIAVRVGLHCAPDAHRTIGTYPQGTVRVSPGYFTTEEEIELFLSAVTQIAAK